MLSQDHLDDLGAYALGMRGSLVETVAYKTSNSASVLVSGYFSGFSRLEMTADPLLRALLRFKVRVADFTGEPAIKDVLHRADGSMFDVNAIDGGPGHAWWFLTVRKVH